MQGREELHFFREEEKGVQEGKKAKEFTFFQWLESGKHTPLQSPLCLQEEENVTNINHQIFEKEEIQIQELIINQLSILNWKEDQHITNQ